MARRDEVLSEVGLNTPTRKPILNIMNVETPFMLGKENGREVDILNLEETKLRISRANVLKFHPTASLNDFYNTISDFMKQPSDDDLQKIHHSFTHLYTEFKSKHQIKRLMDLTRQHLMFIIKLLDMSQFDQAIKEILTLYNQTNFKKIRDLQSALLADYSINNQYYLSTLKILSMQVLLKTKSTEKYTEVLLKVFSKDYRYILKDPSLKIHAVVKLLLNFFNILPKYKALFGLKILQYVEQFHLNFNLYIKNMDVATFQKQILQFASKSQKYTAQFLLVFYHQYSKHNTSEDKLMISELITTSGDDKRIMKLIQLFDHGSVKQLQLYFATLSVLSAAEHEDLISFIGERLKRKCNITDKLLIVLLFYLRYANNEITLPSKQHMSLLDKIMLFTNSNLRTIPPSSTQMLLENMAEFCIDNGEFKRLANITNVSFNAFVIHKNYLFLRISVNLELYQYLSVKRNDSMFAKFEKFISNSSPDQALSIFSHIFNVFITFDDYSLSSLLNIVQSKCLRCFKKLKAPHYFEFPETSEVMTCLLYGSTTVESIPYSGWGTLTQMVYSSFNSSGEWDHLDVNTKVCKFDALFQYETLIKTVYCLNMEMKKRSCLNLSAITRIFMTKWVSNLPPGERISKLEITLVRTLFEYLKFNKFNKKIVELSQLIKTHREYYQPLIIDVKRWLLEAYVELGMVDATRRQAESLLKDYEATIDIKETGFDLLCDFLETQLTIVSHEKDFIRFNELFINQIPQQRAELYDINNQSGLPIKNYLRVLMFNIKMIQTAARLQFWNNNMTEALIEAKRSLKLCQSLIKKSDKLSQSTRLELVTLLVKLFVEVINIYSHVGLSKDSEYYINEFCQVIGELKDATAVYGCLHFVFTYYVLTDQTSIAESSLKKANKTFNYLDGSENIDALTKFLFDNREYKKLKNSLSLFFSGDLQDTLLVDYWTLKMGNTIQDTRGYSQYKAMNDVNKGKELYSRIVKQMDIDPFFRSMGESVMTIPSCSLPMVQDTRSNPLTDVLGTPVGKKVFPFSPLNSPRSSSLTPRGKSIKQKFDKANAINNLQMIKRLVETLNSDSIKNHELADASALYSLSLSMLSSVSAKAVADISLLQQAALNELPKCMPFYYDKLFSRLGNEIYESFKPALIGGLNAPVAREKQAVLETQSKIGTWGDLFNVISIDICSFTGDLLLSKVESDTGKRFNLRLPLNRHTSRDADEATLNFQDAINQLNTIIQESNLTTSLEVTAAINSKEDRRKWWQRRYNLDDRMKELMGRIEFSWLGGFKGFFKQEIIDPVLFKEFKRGFWDVLQQNLPTRKQFGNPSMFLQLDDSVLELFLKLDLKNSHEDKNVELMEDLIYLVFDILLFHGEENAYDEIDTHLIHIRLEELINEYHQRVQDPRKFKHTFLVISSSCHIIPWERLSIMSDISVTRVPSVKFLNDMLERYNGTVSPCMQLRDNVAMVLNPQGDLERTEKTFKEKFTNLAIKSSKSKLIIGEKPDEKTMLDMLLKSDLFVYVGHGGGEQYIRAKNVKLCDKVAPSLLLGCSSAYMKNYGKLEPSGTVYSYLVGGCPMVVGNLWDVTDKDIDKFSESLFEHIGFTDETQPGAYGNGKNIAEAVSLSRDVCHLKYLNGAAPVVYGLPFIFNCQF